MVNTTTASKASQSITVTTSAPATAAYNTTFTVAAYASSALTVTYSSGSPTVCTNSGAAFTMISGSGACRVQYDVAATANFTAASQVVETTTAGKATPTATLAVNNTPQSYSGVGQAATVAISASSVPGALGNILTGGAATQTNAGTYAVTATFTPTDTINYTSLTGLSAGNFVINKAAGLVTINNIPGSATVGGNFTPTFTKSGDGIASTATTTPSICSVVSGVVTYLTAGQCNLQASVTAGTNYEAATGSLQQFTISSGKSNQTITVTQHVPSMAAAIGSYTVTATASSGLGVGITTSGNCSGSGTGSALITVGPAASAGACTVSFDQGGNSNYNPALPVQEKMYQLTTAVTPATGGFVLPLTGNWYAAGSTATVSATPSTGYKFVSWSGPAPAWPPPSP